MDHGKRRGQDHGNKKRDGTGSKPQQGGGEKGSGDNLKDKTHAPYPTIVVRYVESELDTEIIDNGATICKLKTAAINAMEDNIRNMNIPGDNVRLKATVVFKLKAIDDNSNHSLSSGFFVLSLCNRIALIFQPAPSAKWPTPSLSSRMSCHS